MTTRERLIKMLVDRGMFENQAEEVFDLFEPKANAMSPQYSITWDRPASEYPDSLFAIWMMTLDEVALDYIDRTCPKAWFRTMFDSKQFEKMQKEEAFHSNE